MVAAARAILCEMAPKRLPAPAPSSPPTTRLRSADASSPETGKIVLQPRLCTLRSYGSGSRDIAVIRSPPGSGNGAGVSPFLASLAEYIDSSRKSHDFEIVSGRLAMIAFAMAVAVEVATGNSIFRKMEVGEIAKAGGVCVAVVVCAAAFAWFSSNRKRIGQMLILSCNSLVDSFVDNLIDGLFFDADFSDWSDDV